MTHNATRQAAVPADSALSQLQIDLLMQFGKSESAGEGTLRVYFDKRLPGRSR